MLNINVRNSLPELTRQINKMQKDIGDKAVAMALNKTLAKANTEVNRQITQEFAITRDEVTNSVYLQRAYKTQGAELSAFITLFGSRKKRGRSLNVRHFLEKKVTLAEARRRDKAGTKKQLFFKLKRTAGLKTIKGAFVGNKGRTVFRRTGKKRLPIEPVQMIGISQMANTKRISAAVKQRILKEFPIEFGRAIKLFGIGS